MTECGYPDGHRLASGRDDAWVIAKEFGFHVGQPIRWHYRNNVHNGLVFAIRRRVIEAVDNENALHWRIPPTQIEVVAVRVDKPIAVQKTEGSSVIPLGASVAWKQDGVQRTGKVIGYQKWCCLVLCDDEATWKIPFSLLEQ
jgi:hypothetical protein